MRILGLEFSSTDRSVALGTGQASPAKTASPCVPLGLTVQHDRDGGALEPFAMIDEVLRQGGIERTSIDLMAVGLGPGSYAGVRTAIAIAQGWQLASGIHTLGISSVLCLAHQAGHSGYAGLLDVAVDAQRGEFYLASYHLGPGLVEEVSQLHLASRAAVQACLDAGHRVIGPNLTNWFPQAKDLAPCASMLCQLASRIEEAALVKAEQLEPIYLRPTAFVKAPKPRRY